MRKNWVWLLVVGCFLLVLILAGMGLNAAPRALAPPQRLPDGSIAIPLGFTVGTTKHRWIQGNGFQQALSRVLPPFAGVVGASVQECTTLTGTTPVLWLRRVGGNPSNAYYPSRRTVLDSDGCEVEQGSGGGTYSQSNAADIIEAIPLTAFNRRDPEIRLRFYSYTGTGLRQDAEFKLRNPAPSTAPGWTPQPLPATATDGPLTVTLNEVVTRCDMNEPPRLATGREDAWTLLRAHTAENGKQNGNWTIANMDFSDATGNSGSGGASSSSVENEEIRYRLRTTLCPREPAWKVRLEMSRRAGFAPGELWTLKNILVPSAKERKTIAKTMKLQGVSLQCVDFRGEKAPPDGSVMMSGTPSLQVKALGWHPGLRLTLVSVTDQLGRKVESAGSSYDTSGNFGFGLRPAPNARSLNVTLAVSPSRYVEFRVHPTLPAVAAPTR